MTLSSAVLLALITRSSLLQDGYTSFNVGSEWTMKLPSKAQITGPKLSSNSKHWRVIFHASTWEITAIKKDKKSAIPFDEVVRSLKDHVKVMGGYPERTAIDLVESKGRYGYVLISNAGTAKTRYGFASLCLDSQNSRVTISVLTKNPTSDDLKVVRETIMSVEAK